MNKQTNLKTIQKSKKCVTLCFNGKTVRDLNPSIIKRSFSSASIGAVHCLDIWMLIGRLWIDPL